MEDKPLSGLLWRIAAWVASLLLLIAIIHTLSMLLQPITLG